MADVNLKENRGFSLVELSIVLGIMVLVSAFSIPMLSSAMEDMQLISGVRSIATALTYAKISSTAHMIHYRVSFDMADNEWSVEKETAQNSGVFAAEQAINSLRSGDAGSEIAFKSTSSTAPDSLPTESSATITFNSRGMPMGGAQVVYLSKSDADFAVGVSLTGRVQIWRNVDDQWVSQ